MKPLNRGMYTFKIAIKTNMKGSKLDLTQTTRLASHLWTQAQDSCYWIKTHLNQPRSIIQCPDTRHPQLNMFFQMFLTRGLDVVMCDGFPVIDKVFLQGQRRGKLQERQSHRDIIACCLFVYMGEFRIHRQLMTTYFTHLIWSFFFLISKWLKCLLMMTWNNVFTPRQVTYVTC